jgi:V8-like Glu-specific endopeptidase
MLLNSVIAQKIDMSRICTYCRCDTVRCGPWYNVDSTDKIIGARTSTIPYPNILHIETHRKYFKVKSKIDYGTVSFFNSNTLITAKHVLSGGDLVQIKLSGSTPDKDNWISFNKGTDFKVFEYPYNGVQNDIAVIKILNKTKLAQVYKGEFSISNIDEDKFDSSQTVNLTGYSCYFANDPAEHDTLVNKTTIFSKLNFSKKRFFAYHLFTCIGDSGAPLWIAKDGKYYIIGIHHGGGEDAGFPEKDEYNISVRLNQDLIQWLNSYDK